MELLLQAVACIFVLRINDYPKNMYHALRPMLFLLSSSLERYVPLTGINQSGLPHVFEFSFRERS